MPAQNNTQPNSQFGRRDARTSPARLPEGTKLGIFSKKKEKEDGIVVSIREIDANPSPSTEWKAFFNAVKDGLWSE